MTTEINEDLIQSLEALLGAFSKPGEREYREFWDVCLPEHREDGTPFEEFQERVKQDARAAIAKARGQQ
jgi:hypothetical protein